MNGWNLLISKEKGNINPNDYLNFIIENMKKTLGELNSLNNKSSGLSKLHSDLENIRKLSYNILHFFESCHSSICKEKLWFIFNRLAHGCEFYIFEDELDKEAFLAISSDFKGGFDIVNLE